MYSRAPNNGHRQPPLQHLAFMHRPGGHRSASAGTPGAPCARIRKGLRRRCLSRIKATFNGALAQAPRHHRCVTGSGRCSGRRGPAMRRSPLARATLLDQARRSRGRAEPRRWNVGARCPMIRTTERLLLLWCACPLTVGDRHSSS